MKSNKLIIITIVLAALIILGALYFSSKGSSAKNNDIKNVDDVSDVNNVSIVDGKQIIELKAKAGFSPVHSFAKAGIPTVLRINTNGTFDCSSVVSIPSLKIRENLPLSGVTDVDLGSPKSGLVDGTCGMGMYPFDIEFK